MAFTWKSESIEASSYHYKQGKIENGVGVHRLQFKVFSSMKIWKIAFIQKNHEAAFFLQRMQKKRITVPELSHSLNAHRCLRPFQVWSFKLSTHSLSHAGVRVRVPKGSCVADNSSSVRFSSLFFRRAHRLASTRIRTPHWVLWVTRLQRLLTSLQTPCLLPSLKVHDEP